MAAIATAVSPSDVARSPKLRRWYVAEPSRPFSAALLRVHRETATGSTKTPARRMKAPQASLPHTVKSFSMNSCGAAMLETPPATRTTARTPYTAAPRCAPLETPSVDGLPLGDFSPMESPPSEEEPGCAAAAALTLRVSAALIVAARKWRTPGVPRSLKADAVPSTISRGVFTAFECCLGRTGRSAHRSEFIWTIASELFNPVQLEINPDIPVAPSFRTMLIFLSECDCRILCRY
mmetsp:Transcript_42304/g.100353  ORF Transcript_42304/g.100353 Transcript_42304/m.100353 type:complete len:236 (+) Transcript_42304:867-1574(+)